MGSRFWPIGGGSLALPSWTIVKYSCRSYPAVASLAASIHIHYGHCLDSKDYIAMKNLQFLCLSLRRFSQFDSCTFLGLLYVTPKYRSTSFASPMNWEWFEGWEACQWALSSSLATSERSVAPSTSMFQSCRSFAMSAFEAWR